MPRARIERARTPTVSLAPDVLLSGVRRLRLLAWVLVAMFASGAMAVVATRLLGIERPSWMDASALLDRSLAIKTRAYGPAHDSVAGVAESLGDLAIAAGDDGAAALAHFQQALEIR